MIIKMKSGRFTSKNASSAKLICQTSHTKKETLKCEVVNPQLDRFPVKAGFQKSKLSLSARRGLPRSLIPQLINRKMGNVIDLIKQKYPDMDIENQFKPKKVIQTSMLEKAKVETSNRIEVRAEAVDPGPRYSGSNHSPWIKIRNNIQVMRFVIFNMASDMLDKRDMRKIARAIEKDSLENYAKDWSVVAEVEVRDEDDIMNSDFMDGSWIPIFVGDFRGYAGDFFGYHTVQTPGGFLIGGGNVTYDIGIQVPLNFPVGTPWIAVNSTSIMYSLVNGIYMGNPHAFSDPTEFFSFVSSTISHEVHETMGNDHIANFVYFDTSTPATQNWYLFLPDGNGNPYIYYIDGDGYVELPPLNDFVFGPYIGFVPMENGDVVDEATCSKFDTYEIDGVSMANYPTRNFWKPWLVDYELKLDHIGNATTPLDPYAGVHEFAVVTDLMYGFTFVVEIQNYGPVTSYERAHEMQSIYGPGWNPALNNFRPGTTLVSFLGFL